MRRSLPTFKHPGLSDSTFDNLIFLYLRLSHFLTQRALRLRRTSGRRSDNVRTLLISLPMSEDRRHRLFSRMDRTSWGLSAIDACYPPDRESLDDAEWKLFHEMSARLATGERGCFLSHRRAWREALESGFDFTIILEDDVVPLYGRLPPLPALPEDLDVLHLHHFAQRLPTGRQLLVDFLRAPYECLAGPFRFYRIDEVALSHCGRLNRAAMLGCAYGVTKSGARKLLSIFDEVGMFYHWDSIAFRHAMSPSTYERMLPYVHSDSCRFYRGQRSGNASLKMSAIRLNAYAIYPPVFLHDYVTPSVLKAVPHWNS